MTVAEIIALVKDAIEDESFDDDKILGYVNKGVGRVAAALPLPLRYPPFAIPSQSYPQIPHKGSSLP